VSATLQTEADAAARLHRLISARPALHAGFLSAWRQIDAAADSPAALDDWCRAVLALLDVNAGAASLIAFWSLRPVAGADLSALAGVGRAAASICRQAGAAATRACLEATGRLADAERLCRQILQAEPHHAEAANLLGLLAVNAEGLAGLEELRTAVRELAAVTPPAYD